jgi:membrane-bound ClpP family serine protease
MINFIYLLIIIAWALLIMGFLSKDYAIAALASFLMMVLGVDIAANGIDGLNNLATQGFAVISICLGTYVLIRGAIDTFKEL